MFLEQGSHVNVFLVNKSKGLVNPSRMGMVKWVACVIKMAQSRAENNYQQRL
jgi:hypothetical protein